MSFGMRIWGEDASLQFNTDTVTWRIVLSELVSFSGSPSNVTRTFSVPGCNPSNSVAYVLPVNNNTGTDRVYRQLEAEIGNNVAYVRNFLGGYNSTITWSTATMRLIVMRWR